MTEYPLAPPPRRTAAPHLDVARRMNCVLGTHMWTHHVLPPARGFAGTNELVCQACALRVRIAEVIQP